MYTGLTPAEAVEIRRIAEKFNVGDSLTDIELYRYHASCREAVHGLERLPLEIYRLTLRDLRSKMDQLADIKKARNVK